MKPFLYQFLTGVAAGCLGLLAQPAQGQQARSMALLGTDPTATAYIGPRYPGGPDSLRAILQRQLRPASPALAGQLYLRLELDSLGRPRRAQLLTPPAGPNAALASNTEALALAEQVVRHLQPWQLSPATTGQSGLATSVTLPLAFGPAAQSGALLYSDENPTFPAQSVRGRPIPNLIYFVQTQVRYPADDVRHGRQGVVYAYFEVSETGALEQRRIVGSVSPTLDAEIMRVLNNLPDALAPPHLAGRPVRVSYVLPFTFKIQ